MASSEFQRKALKVIDAEIAKILLDMSVDEAEFYIHRIGESDMNEVTRSNPLK